MFKRERFSLVWNYREKPDTVSFSYHEAFWKSWNPLFYWAHGLSFTYSHSAEEHFMSFMGTVNTYKTRVFSMYYTLFMVSTRSRLRFGIAFGIVVGINFLKLLLIILPPIMIPVFHFHHFYGYHHDDSCLVVNGRWIIEEVCLYYTSKGSFSP